MDKKYGSCMVLHADLFVRSMDVALNFYCKFGFSVVEDAIIRGPIIRSLSRGMYDEARVVLLRVSSIGAMIELQEFQRDSALTSHSLDLQPGTGLVSILVSNLESHMNRAKNVGLYPESDVFTVDLPHQGNCHVVFYKDPDGNRLEFLQVQQFGLQKA